MTKMKTIFDRFPDDAVYRVISSPVGNLLLVASDEKLLAVLFQKGSGFGVSLKRFQESKTHPILKKTKLQLEEYFGGKRTRFDLPMKFYGTEFQKRVWRELGKVPYGKTRSYSAQATRVGGAEKVRAVAGANGKNPLSIVAPCHRIIGKDGSLTGFGGGLSTKQWLLDHEKKVLSA